MICYRVTPEPFAQSLAGTGARRHGGRWNRKGTAVLYTSNSTALCLLEILVNVRQQYLPAYHSMVIEVPDALVDPADPVFFPQVEPSREHGEQWVQQNRWVAMRLPPLFLPQAKMPSIFCSTPTIPILPRSNSPRACRFPSTGA